MRANEQKKRRQVSFNIDDALYSEFKKVMIDQRTTPTAFITRTIKEAVDGAKEKKEGVSND